MVERFKKLFRVHGFGFHALKVQDLLFGVELSQTEELPPRSFLIKPAKAPNIAT